MRTVSLDAAKNSAWIHRGVIDNSFWRYERGVMLFRSTPTDCLRAYVSNPLFWFGRGHSSSIDIPELISARCRNDYQGRTSIGVIAQPLGNDCQRLIKFVVMDATDSRTRNTPGINQPRKWVLQEFVMIHSFLSSELVFNHKKRHKMDTKI
jgi:hypothetical protein